MTEWRWLKVNIKNTGKTALHLAALNNHHDVVKLLISCEADVAATDDAGNTPLHYAAYRWITYLIERDDGDVYCIYHSAKNWLNYCIVIIKISYCTRWCSRLVVGRWTCDR